MQRWPLNRIQRWIIFVVSTVAGFYALRFALFIFLVAYMLYQRDFMDVSAKNGRGDVASAETDFYEVSDQRVKTVIRLHRAGHWFLTTLVEARSFEVLVGLHWRNDDTLDVQLDFGCEPQMEHPATAVGPILIVYHWGDPGHVPGIGYESFRRRDLPPKPCPAIGAEAMPRVTEPPLIPTP
jgi:hypothetical protein